MRRLLALLALLTLLAACTSLPTEGPVNATRAPTGTDQAVGFHAAEPREGSTPEEIVQGFLTASAAGLSDDFEVARQYLSSTASELWRPLEVVRIYSDSRPPVTTRTDTEAVRLNLGSEGSLQQDGRFEPSSPDAVITTEFSLARNAEGEWRIIDLDNGLLISSTLFTSQYSRAVLHFLTADSQYLVPDLRWFPQNTYATLATTQLFDGPVTWLADAVRTAIPPGTALGNRGITISGGSATVSLNDEVLSVTGYQRALFSAQVEETLAVLPNVQTVELLVEGTPWSVGQTAALSPYPLVDPELIVNVAGRPSFYRDGSAVSLRMSEVPTDLDALAVGYGENAPAVGISGNSLVGLTNRGGSPVTLLEGTDLAAPSVDIYDWVWTASADRAGTVTALANEQRVDLSVSLPKGGIIESIHISREGARAVFVWRSDATTHMSVAAINRGGDGAPVDIGELIDIGAGLEQILDVAWIDETTVAALATLPGGTSAGIYSVPIGGPISAITEVNGAVSITAGAGERSLILATENGQVLERSGGGWRLLLTDGSSPALPG